MDGNWACIKKIIIGDKRRKQCILGVESNHVLTQLKLYELCSTSFKMKSYFGKEAFKAFSYTKFLK